MELYKKPFQFKDQIFWALISQWIPLIGLSCIMSPEPFLLGFSAFVGHWAGFIIAANRRPHTATLTDVLFVKLGYPVLLCLSPFIAIPVLAFKRWMFHN